MTGNGVTFNTSASLWVGTTINTNHTNATMPEKVRAAHLLIKHTASRNPVSRRTGQQVTLTPQNARSEINAYLAKIQSEGLESFPHYAKERSDCSSFRADGDLGFFERGMMQEAFEVASFGLGVGEMSGLVETDSGCHLIYRIA